MDVLACTWPGIRLQGLTELPMLFQHINFSNIHVNWAADPHPDETNKFSIIEPLVATVRNACLKLPREEHYSVDKQMIPFTGRASAKKFIKSKPNPVGVKNKHNLPFCRNFVTKCMAMVQRL